MMLKVRRSYLASGEALRTLPLLTQRDSGPSLFVPSFYPIWACRSASNPSPQAAFRRSCGTFLSLDVAVCTPPGEALQVVE